MRGKGKIFLIIWAVLMTLISGALLGFEIMRGFGRANLDSKSATTAPVMAKSALYEGNTTGDTKWQDDWIRYNGAVYDYNEDIITFLIMGIDKDDEIVTKVAEGTDGGQADALFLLALNPHNQTISIIGINRNTMTDVDIYDEYGRYQTTAKAQISLQHGFGNGMEESCEYQVKAVSNLFHQLPIHGYAAINMSAIPVINDQVGGVDVVVLEDLTKFDKKLKKGARVHLEGETAFHYVKSRDIYIPNSNGSRLERQRQYINSFINSARTMCRENNNAAVELFTAIGNKMVTNISADEISYLAPFLVSYKFDIDNIVTIDGKTEKNGKFEEFYVDENSLYEAIVNVFYEKINDTN